MKRLLAVLVVASLLVPAVPLAAMGAGKADAVRVAVVSSAYDEWVAQRIGEVLPAAEADFGTRIDEVNTDRSERFAKIFRRFAHRQFPLVIGNFFPTDEALTSVAQQHPQTLFVSVDGDATGSNVAQVGFDTYSGSYLAGVLAAGSTQSDFDVRLNPELKVGFIGGMEIPAVMPFAAGFLDGAKSVSPDVVVYEDWVGSFTSPDVAYELAASQIAAGVDVVFAAAGYSGEGAARACHELGALFIGVDSDQYYTLPEYSDVILSSMIKDVALADYLVVGAFTQNTDDLVPGGDPWILGLAEDAVRLAPYHEFEGSVPTSITEAIEEARQELM